VPKSCCGFLNQVSGLSVTRLLLLPGALSEIVKTIPTSLCEAVGQQSASSIRASL